LCWKVVVPTELPKKPFPATENCFDGVDVPRPTQPFVLIETVDMEEVAYVVGEAVAI
jgi:hypothetical protein